MKVSPKTLLKRYLVPLMLAFFLPGCGQDSGGVNAGVNAGGAGAVISSLGLQQPVPGLGAPERPLTTVDRAIVTVGAGTYKKLAYGPGWARVVRSELASPQAGRELRRQTLLCMPHFSDVHIMDDESPLRTEFLRNLNGAFLPATEFQAAWRPQESLTTQVADSMVRRMNATAVGPVTLRPFDCAVFTGDNGDNRHQSELQRFLTLMDGGTIHPSTGDPNLYEGVQDGQSPVLKEYWHPDSAVSDDYKTKYGFPDYPGLLQAAVLPFTASGLKTPWYTCYGNHDHLIQGNFPVRPTTAPVNALTNIAEGNSKILALPLIFQLLGQKLGVDAFLAEFLDPLGPALPSDWAAFIGHWLSPTTLARSVTADPTRHILNKQEFVQAHLASGSQPGPVGHGFTSLNQQSGHLYYTFEPAPGILGITLDTTNPGGLNNGSVDADQVAWMEQQIQKVSSRYYDAKGNLVKTGNPNKLVMLFSHHSIETLTNALPDTENPQTRLLAAAFEQVLHRYPNVIVWLNGHTHYCRVYSHDDPTRRTPGFWEVNSPALIDFPQQARIVEMVDNRDGTLSIFATLVDTAAPPETSTPSDPESLASISRELSANDPQLVNQPGGLDFQIGQPGDRNVELLINKPF